jgi:hypothetical protein
MASKITRDIIESYLNCKYKGHLKLTGESGKQSDYETMTTATRAASREATLVKLVARYGDACWGRAVTATTLKQGVALLVDGTFEDESLSLHFDALKQVEGPSRLGDHHYLPVLHKDGNVVGAQQKLLLAFTGWLSLECRGCGPLPGWSPVARRPG